MKLMLWYGVAISEAEAVSSEDAVKYTLISRQDLRVNAAIEMYRSGRVSLGRATELAGMSIFEFKEL